ncbi:PP2C family protein-serine/threonine phosphatase [Planobispora takensis]|uniref:Uncharacterized protein n=1 Tax=Planobispora takensis TaxID=1367882 RepID=A0A8J3T085_9ACTN|nr:GAF domain-containing SpoIIE family protein phosphatase [Planobispora takensis]GII02607.1 hypothetical protein Pta02_46150 [Planobispora takensis]
MSTDTLSGTGGAAAEEARLAAVHRYRILDTPPDDAFDRLAALAALVFETPMAAITIVDEDRIWFKARQGLPAGPRQIHRDAGLCGEAILQDGPYIVTDATGDERAARDPLVHGEPGVRFYAAVPLTTSDGHRLGTINVLDTAPRTAAGKQLRALRDLAAVVVDELDLRVSALSTVTRERRMRRELEAEKQRLETLSSALQRSLLPPLLPRVPGLELAACYHSASCDRVGGDFYDAFPMEGGRLGFFLGDVCGKGAEAAALTSLTRYTLRAAATYHPDPVSVLTNLNTVLLQEQQPDEPRYCTVQFGLLTPDGDGFDLVLAAGGHPPAQLVRAGGRVEALHPPNGSLVGIFPHPTITAVRARLEPGDGLLLHSDGLTESYVFADDAPAGREMFGDERLTALARSLAGLPAATMIDVVDEVVHRLGRGMNDDTAVLAITVPPPGGRAQDGRSNTLSRAVTWNR